jgi:hypothetical protein
LRRAEGGANIFWGILCENDFTPKNHIFPPLHLFIYLTNKNVSINIQNIQNIYMLENVKKRKVFK